MALPKHNRTLNDIRYFESSYLPSDDLPSPYYMGKLFVQPPSSVAFGQLIGAKCNEVRLTIRGGSALYVLFTSALPEGRMQRLEYKAEVWQTWIAYGWPDSYNTLAPEEQSERLQDATFNALHHLAPDFESELRDIENQYKTHGSLLRVRGLEKSARGYIFVVSSEVRPITEVSNLWLEVTETKSGRYAEVVITPLKRWIDGPFLANRISTTPEEVILHPRKSAAGNYYTKGYITPFRARMSNLFPG